MNAPIDRFARGENTAMSSAQKRGALVFFGKANCVQCHAVAGGSNEVFSDFQMHVAGIPQIAPRFGAGLGDVPFRNRRGQFSEDGNQVLVSSISRKRTEILASSGRHLCVIWVFNLRFFTMAHLPVSPRRSVIIWMRWNSDRNMTPFKQKSQPI
jgi:hypothetical protein